jgi:hypothetical protein
MSQHAPPRGRRLAVAVQTVALVMIAVAVGFLLYGDRRAGRYSTHNYDRIKDGATLAEVEALLGGPGTDLSEELPQGALGAPVDRPHRFIEWKEPGGPGCIVIALDADGKVCRKRMVRPSF